MRFGATLAHSLLQPELPVRENWNILSLFNPSGLDSEKKLPVLCSNGCKTYNGRVTLLRLFPLTAQLALTVTLRASISEPPGHPLRPCFRPPQGPLRRTMEASYSGGDCWHISRGGRWTSQFWIVLILEPTSLVQEIGQKGGLCLPCAAHPSSIPGMP